MMTATLADYDTFMVNSFPIREFVIFDSILSAVILFLILILFFRAKRLS